MLERGDRDAGVDRALQRLRRVVDQQVDADLLAAGDLVAGAVELVVGQADLLQPAGGGVVRLARAVGGDVDEVAGLVPARDGLDRAGIRLGGEDVRLGVCLADGGVQLLGLEAVDLPHDLVGVGDRDAETALRDLLQLVPVVVEGRVDVDGDAHRRGWVR